MHRALLLVALAFSLLASACHRTPDDSAPSPAPPAPAPPAVTTGRRIEMRAQNPAIARYLRAHPAPAANASDADASAPPVGTQR